MRNGPLARSLPACGEGWGGAFGKREICATPPRRVAPTLPTRGRVAVAPACGIRKRSGMSLPAEKPTPAPADELPFWRRKAMKDMTPGGVGEPVRRLRPLLPEQAAGGGHRPHLLHRRRLQAPGRADLPLHRLRQSLGQGEGLRHADDAQHQPHLMAAADLRLQARGGGEGFVLVASARLRRPGDGASRRGCRCGGRSARARSTCRTRIWRIIS